MALLSLQLSRRCLHVHVEKKVSLGYTYWQAWRSRSIYIYQCSRKLCGTMMNDFCATRDFQIKNNFKQKIPGIFLSEPK